MRKNVKGKGIGRKHAGMYAAVSVPNVGKTDARGVSEVWQTLGLETRLFGCVAIVGLTGEFSDVWQIKKLGDGGQGAGVRQEKESRDRRGCEAANTGENSTPY